jgi:hypothetical protein
MAISDAQFEILASMMYGALAGLVGFLAISIFQMFWLSFPAALAMGAMVWLVALFSVGALVHRNARKLRDMRLGWEAELAAAEELNRLMRDGYHVFHDFPAETFNIDHILVGPAGVFAVETKGRTKLRKGGDKDHVVRYDGQRLMFAGRLDGRPLEQARRQAAWLSKWLRNVTGEAAFVVPALTIPGWFLEVVGKGDVLVFPPKMARSALTNTELAKPLSPKRVEQIAAAIERQCRSLPTKKMLL